MPTTLKVLDRLAAWMAGSTRVTVRFTTHRRIADFAVPLIAKLITDDDDGDAYRTAIMDWRWAPHPPVAVYRGACNSCRIDGPRQWVEDYALPLGGLILAPGVTAHLTPFEARELHGYMKDVIDRAIWKWIVDHDLQNLPSVPEEIDRREADRAAKAMIADWAARQARKRPAADEDAEGPDHA